jgi:hypothetical protein
MALRVVVKAKEVIEGSGDPDAFRYAGRHTPGRIAAMVVDDRRLVTLGVAFTAAAQGKKERGGGRASLGKARAALRLWNALMPAIPSQEVASRHAVAFRDRLDRVPVDRPKSSLSFIAVSASRRRSPRPMRLPRRSRRRLAGRRASSSRGGVPCAGRWSG